MCTFINEDVLDPNCVATTVLHRGKLKIRVTTTCEVSAGSSLSLNYRALSSDAVRLVSLGHRWGRALTPSGQLSTGTRRCANSRYHASGPRPLTSMLCVDCTAAQGRFVGYCCDGCFDSHVADFASDDPADREMCRPVRANNVKAVATRVMTPRASSRF